METIKTLTGASLLSGTSGKIHNIRDYGIISGLPRYQARAESLIFDLQRDVEITI